MQIAHAETFMLMTCAVDASKCNVQCVCAIKCNFIITRSAMVSPRSARDVEMKQHDIMMILGLGVGV